jgi:hypothetical protein
MQRTLTYACTVISEDGFSRRNGKTEFAAACDRLFKRVAVRQTGRTPSFLDDLSLPRDDVTGEHTNRHVQLDPGFELAAGHPIQSPIA